MMVAKISTGTSVMDELLKNGYDADAITTIYGPFGSGKTNLAILAALETVKNGKKVIYVDTEGSFSVERLKQITEDYMNVLEQILFLKPISFEEQKKAFEKLRLLINDKIGLIIVDSIAMLYRVEIGRTDDVVDVNRALGQQLSYLTEIARTMKIPVLITNQVYSDFENKSKVNMVGGDLLKYQSKCLIELQKLHKNKRVAIIRKHRALPEEKSILFAITDKGIEKVE
ncbi:DNA repair and recombination protein RadB [Candidatus Woesearchaeota archaeon]|nr:MAG: DNA repair and recombination protein RadB [Candidatus Woesearchaeota archaeon]